MIRGLLWVLKMGKAVFIIAVLFMVIKKISVITLDLVGLPNVCVIWIMRKKSKLTSFIAPLHSLKGCRLFIMLMTSSRETHREVQRNI